MNGVTGAAAVDDLPFAAPIDRDGDRLHATAAKRGAVTRRVIEMHAPQAMRTMVAVLRAGNVEREFKPAVVAFEVGTPAGAVVGAEGIGVVVARLLGPKRMMRNEKTSVLAVVFPVMKKRLATRKRTGEGFVSRGPGRSP